MVLYACLSNTLLLTVLVSVGLPSKISITVSPHVEQILSHTFNVISSDAEAEARFRRAVATIEG